MPYMVYEDVPDVRSSQAAGRMGRAYWPTIRRGVLGCSGLGQTVTDVKGPFWRQTDPVAAFVKALQKYLNVGATGVWDPATHDALGTWWHVYEVAFEAGTPPTKVPAWGQDPTLMAQAALELLDTLGDSGTSNQLFSMLLPLAGYLGLPTSGRAELLAAIATAGVNFQALGEAIKTHIVEKESAAAPPTITAVSTATPPTITAVSTRRKWLIAGGLCLSAVVILGVLVAISQRSRRRRT